MAGFVLRVKTKSGQKVVKGLKPTDRVSLLKDKLSDITGIKNDMIHVLVGFPPKPLDLNNDDLTLSETNITSGDTLIVEEKIRIIDEKSNLTAVNKNIKSITNEDNDDNNLPRSHIVNSDSFADTPGILMKKIVPADNSCLFTSVGYVLNGKIDPSCASYMREIIANAVASDPDEYSEAILGRPNSEYCEWILKPDSWGGAIELSILSRFYGLEIAVVDSINAIINRFGEDQHYAQRVFLLFNGIHYDPLYLESLNGGSIQTIFLTEDDGVLVAAEQLAREAKSSRQYTDVQKFTLKCMDCDVQLSGQEAASQHAKETGHVKFGEIVA
ncbi:ubiquitin thioesterase OTU1 [Venturia canescens]|uniref:ubiquitin thioesterase OTU1 n=1 Tax=Venturia canescens TaxID=32260 RepID=UPI001C9C7C8D|nr:ubiquitin thioesterase OTU1 [Venturia canescens]